MKLKELLKLVEENPAYLEYNLCMSTYMAIDGAHDGDDLEEEDFQVIVDNPIRGIATNDETKEIRFILSKSDISVCEQSPDDIKRLWHDAGGPTDEDIRL